MYIDRYANTLAAYYEIIKREHSSAAATAAGMLGTSCDQFEHKEQFGLATVNKIVSTQFEICAQLIQPMHQPHYQLSACVHEYKHTQLLANLTGCFCLDLVTTQINSVMNQLIPMRHYQLSACVHPCKHTQLQLAHIE